MKGWVEMPSGLISWACFSVFQWRGGYSSTLSSELCLKPINVSLPLSKIIHVWRNDKYGQKNVWLNRHVKFFSAIQENEALGCNCARVIIAFIFRPFTEDENQTTITSPRLDSSRHQRDNCPQVHDPSTMLTELILGMKIAAPPTQHPPPHPFQKHLAINSGFEPCHPERPHHSHLFFKMHVEG